MPYTVFALKWRPQDFESIIGQDHIVGTLKNAIQRAGWPTPTFLPARGESVKPQLPGSWPKRLIAKKARL